MTLQDVKKISSVIFILGLLVGVIYVNLFGKNYILSMGIFSDYFLEQYSNQTIIVSEYIWYIMKIRIVPIIVLSILSNTKFRRMAGTIFLVWTGLLSGIIITTAVLRMSIKGIILCIIAILPHFICYIATYMMLLTYIYTYPNGRWSRIKTISIVLFTLLGIVSECYINPVFVDLYIDVL